MRLYIDVCCLNRPFDNQTQDRIHLEAEALILILKHVESGEWQWFTSEVVNFEIQQTPNAERRYEVQLLTRHAQQQILLTPAITQRTAELKRLGFTTYDAFHLACAEAVPVEVLLTTDDAMLKRSRRMPSMLRIQLQNPLEWLWEQVKS